jgi:putative endopeptidase
LINVTAFFNFGEQQDFKDARKQIAIVDQGGLGLPERDFYFRTGEVAEKTRAQYVQHITNMLKLMGEPEAIAAADAQKIMHWRPLWPRFPWTSPPNAIPRISTT